MQHHVSRSEVLDIAAYEQQRPQFRQKVLAEKEDRRLTVGEHFTFLFETHDTVLYQIQEMMRVERIVAEKAIQYELDTYNELIPPAGGLSATLLIEYEEEAVRAEILPKLLGIEKHVKILLDGQPPALANFDTRQIGTDRVSSVQYMRFELSPAQREAWADGIESGGIQLVVDHPHYSAQRALPAKVAGALLADIS